MLRPISGLYNCDKIMEQLVVELILSDMKPTLDPSQFGNQESIGIQHYLVRLMHRVISNLDKNTKDEVNAVICLFIDFRQAYLRHCLTLGVNSLIETVFSHLLFQF